MKPATQTWIPYSDGRAGIYRVKNDNTGAVYIGQSVHVGRRVTEHRKKLRQNQHYNKHWQSSWNRHGEDAFSWRLIVEVRDKKDLTRIEQAVVNVYRRAGFDLYNTAAPVDTPMLGRPRPDAGAEFKDPEIRKAAASAWRKWAKSPEGAEKLRTTGAACMKRLRSDPDVEKRRVEAAAEAQRRPEVREGARARALARQKDPKFADKFRAAQAQIAQRTKKRVRHKPTGATYESVSAAAAAEGVSVPSMSNRLNGKKCKGLPPHQDWEFIND